MKNITIPALYQMIVSIAALLAFLAAGLLALWRKRRKKNGATSAELARIQNAENVLRSLLNCSMFGILTNAERKYGGGTGELKKSVALTELLQLLPDEIESTFDADTLSALIEQALQSAKEAWQANPELVKSNSEEKL
ncbi:MAG: hypothetical protein LBB67_06375 [Oscillospiraceae bacterium]|jgi:hypothetical protein|nr:hypothetical protein [Oscillospiraceae bacterium]